MWMGAFHLGRERPSRRAALACPPLAATIRARGPTRVARARGRRTASGLAPASGSARCSRRPKPCACRSAISSRTARTTSRCSSSRARPARERRRAPAVAATSSARRASPPSTPRTTARLTPTARPKATTKQKTRRRLAASRRRCRSVSIGSEHAQQLADFRGARGKFARTCFFIIFLLSAAAHVFVGPSRGSFCFSQLFFAAVRL